MDTPRVSLGGLVAPRWQVRQGAARWLEGGPSPRGPQERVQVTQGNPPVPLRRRAEIRLLLHAGSAYHLGAATGGRCCVPMAAGQPQHACLARASRRSGPPDRPGRPSHPIARVPTSRSSDKGLSDYSPRRAPKPYPGCRPSTAAAAAPPVASTPLPSGESQSSSTSRAHSPKRALELATSDQGRLVQDGRPDG